jgi:hypothetical protein
MNVKKNATLLDIIATIAASLKISNYLVDKEETISMIINAPRELKHYVVDYVDYVYDYYLKVNL